MAVGFLYNLSNTNSCLTPAKNQDPRYLKCWTSGQMVNPLADDFCLSILWSV